MTQIRVTSESDLIEVAPYMLGFVPADSVVGLLFHQSRLVLTFRLDLPNTSSAVADALRPARAAVPYDAMALMIWTDDLQRAAHVAPWLWQAGGDGLSVAVVTETRWASIDAEGVIGEFTSRDPFSPFAAGAVVAGLPRPRSTRDELAGRILPDPDLVAATAAQIPAQQDRLDQLSPRQQVGEVSAYVERWVATRGGMLTADEAAHLTVLVQSFDVRDHAWSSLTRDTAELTASLWAEVARRVDGSMALPVLALAGFSAWLAGNGVLTWLVVDRAHTIHDDYSMINLLVSVASGPVPPEMVEKALLAAGRNLG